MNLTAMTRPLFIPVILGTVRKGRASEDVAKFVLGEVQKREGIETELIDIRDLSFPFDDAGEQIKDALDSNLKEYIHKAVGVCGVSAGGFGGTRVIEALLPVLRELGLVTIFWDGNFSTAHKLFDEGGTLLEPGYVRRIG